MGDSVAKEFAKISVQFIVVNREKRQRRTVGTVQDLADSIKRVGLINPITIDRENVLIAGERRLEACRLLSPDYKIPCRYLDELDSIELQLIELEENLKRSELNWKDQVRAVKNMHDILMEKNESWNQLKTAEYLNLNPAYISQTLKVFEKLSDPAIAKAENVSKALGRITREADRKLDNELNSLFDLEVEPEAKVAKAKILNEDFSLWVDKPTGKFNFIHCDFPYGLNHQKSEQGNISTGAFDSYNDGEELYWELCSILVSNLNNIMMPSGHLMFWFSMKFYQQTIDFFTKNSNLELVDPRPLVWLKSDNKGIVSDITRRPRNIYETALLFSRGDRKILSPVSNAYACPTSKTFHASEKPEPMLRHFFQLFVDEHSEVLDPTCGSGTAIRAAFEMGAKRSLGLEINPEFASAADGNLTKVKALKQLEKEQGNG